MASRYIQKYPIPNDFPLILKEFSRQILRYQPQNIIKFAAQYFQALENGTKMSVKSSYNVDKQQKKYTLNYQPQNARQMKRKDLRINKIQGALSQQQLQKLSKIIDVFYDKYDSDMNGKLQLQQLQKLFKNLFDSGMIDFMPTTHNLQMFLVDLDTTKDGKVSKEQLYNFLRNFIS